MDILHFEKNTKTADNGNNYQVVDIFINQKDLIAMLKVYELPFAQKESDEADESDFASKLAGNYEGIDAETLYRYLTNPQAYEIYSENKVPILDCECGVYGCWSFVVQIVQENERIIWKNFEQVHRSKEWNYANFGQFEFNPENYQNELNKLKEWAKIN